MKQSADPYRMTPHLSTELLEAVADRLEARGKNPVFCTMLNDFLEQMDIDCARNVLDMGCGTGVVTRAIAKRAAFRGVVMGVDISPYLVEFARRIGDKEHSHKKTTFQVGDSCSLDIPDKEMDVVVIHTLLSHVEHPRSVLKEAYRVVRPGGRVGIFEGDFASLAFGHERDAKSTVYDEAIVDGVVTNPRVVRQIPRLIQQIGLKLVSARPYPVADIGTADFWLPTLLLYRKRIPTGGTIEYAEAEEMIAALIRDSEEDRFFGAGTFYSFISKRGQ
jgi:SAM-dependent methyltransferase